MTTIEVRPALVVQAHPVPDSYNNALLEAAVEGLTKSSGTSPVVHRIWQDGPPPAGPLDYNELYLVFPTWWGGLPSPLLAWVQAELGPWIDGNATRLSSPWRTIDTLVAITTYGSGRFVNRLQGEPGKLLLKRSVLPLCSSFATFEWLPLYRMDKLSDDELADHLMRLSSPELSSSVFVA